MKFKGFPNDDRIWRLNMMGNLYEAKHEHSITEIRLSFSPLIDFNGLRYSKKSVATEVNTSVKTNIAYLPFLNIGSAWKKQSKIENDLFYTDKDVYEVTSPNSPSFLALSELISPNSFKVGWPISETPCLLLKNAKLKSTTAEKRKFLISKQVNLIIPCPEIVRFYFGTSSTLIRKLVHGAATNLDELVVFESATGVCRTGVTPNNELYITLRKQLFDVDAWVIARILGDKIAKREAERLYSNLVFAQINDRFMHMMASLPFTGKSNLKVKGYMTKTITGDYAFIALNLISCTADFPFSTLIINRENSNRVLKHTGIKQIGYPLSAFKTTSKSERERPVGFGKEPSKNIILIQYNLQENRFLALKGKKLIKKYKTNAEYKSRYRMIDKKDVDGFEAGDGGYSNNNLAPIEICVGTESCNRMNEKFISNMIMLWKALYILIEKYNCKGAIVDVGSGQRTYEYKLSNFPIVSKWALIVNINEKRARQALWIELKKNNKWYYVVEWEGREKQFGIYLLNLCNGIRASNEELQRVMKEWAINKNNKARKSDGLERGWNRKSIQHPKSEQKNYLPSIIAKRINKHLS